MFIFGLPFLSDFFSLTQFFLPSADAADYGGTAGGGGGNSSIEKTCTWKAMKTMTQEHLKIVSSYDYAAKVKTEKQSGAITVSFQYQEDPKVKTIAATAIGCLIANLIKPFIFYDTLLSIYCFFNFYWLVWS